MKTNPMKSRFAVPVAVALAVHAFLFFGFRRVEVQEIDPTQPPPPPEARKIPPELLIDLKTLKSDDGDNVATTPSKELREDVAPPVMEERLVTDPGIWFTQEPRYVDPAPTGPGVKIIPIGDLTVGRKGGPAETIFTRAALDNTPRLRLQPAPEYPRVMKSQGITGEVYVEFVVDERGRVIDARVIRSSRYEFEEPSLRAVKKWLFEPGLRANRPVKFRMAVPLTYSIGEI